MRVKKNEIRKITNIYHIQFDVDHLKIKARASVTHVQKRNRQEKKQNTNKITTKQKYEMKI